MHKKKMVKKLRKRSSGMGTRINMHIMQESICQKKIKNYVCKD